MRSVRSMLSIPVRPIHYVDTSVCLYAHNIMGEGGLVLFGSPLILHLYLLILLKYAVNVRENPQIPGAENWCILH